MDYRNKWIVLFAFLLAPTVQAITFNVPSTDTDGSFAISWSNPGSYALLYERVGTSGSWSNIFGGGGAISHSLSRSPGTYQYYLYHCYHNGPYPVCANTPVKTLVISMPTPAVPASLSFQNIDSGGDSNGRYRFVWGSVSGADRYEWRERLGGIDWGASISAGANRYVDRSNRADGVWSYQVRACNSIGCSNFSSTASIKVALAPGVPNSLSPSPKEDGRIEVNWAKASGVVSYYDLDYSLNNSGYLNSYDGTSRGRSLPSMPLGTYVFRVRACNTVSGFTGCSDWKYSASVSQSIGTFQYEYDELGRLIRVVDAENRETQYGFDKADNRLQKTVENLP